MCDDAVVSTTRRDPLEGIERLLIDGNNLLHAMRRGASPAPPATLVGRLRAVVPPATRIELVFDGPPDPGSGNVRVASGVTVRYSGRASADALLTRLVADAAPTTIEAATLILVVTDDAELAAGLRRRGAQTARTAWLIGRLERTTISSPSIARARPPQPAAGREAAPDDADERRWRPGRGATAKRGNPRRKPRGASHAG